jgi:hypothetical protein
MCIIERCTHEWIGGTGQGNRKLRGTYRATDDRKLLSPPVDYG